MNGPCKASKMRFHVTPQKAILFTKVSVALSRSWPPSHRATKDQVFLSKILWCGAFVSALMLLLPLLNAIHEYRKDPVILGKSVSLFAAVAQVTIKMVACYLQQKQFQMLHLDMENFCKNANGNEQIILQRYVDKYKYFHSFYTLWCFLTTIFVISGPLYSPQMFPTHAKYPFSVDYQPLKCTIFLHQSLVGFQVSSGMAIDTQIALLLRYATARFEILIGQLKKVQLDSELNTWIRKHDQLLRYTKVMYQSVKLLILATMGTTTLAVIFGSLNLVTSQALPVKMLYALVVFSASVELFMYAWPADNLMHMCAQISTAIYNTNWFEKNIRMRRKVLHILFRSQKLETIRINGILPRLSLSYYATYLYRSFSYFTAVRLMVESTNVN